MKTFLLATLSFSLTAISHGEPTSNPVESPVVNIIASDAEASEIPLVPPGLEMPQRFDPAIFTVWRNGQINTVLEVHYRVSGSASNGVDYEFLSGSVKIPAGAKSASITVAPIDDQLVEGTESVEITLQPVECIALSSPPLGCYQVGPTNHAVAYILDNDFQTNHPPSVTFLKPQDGQSFSAPTNIVLLVDTVDLDGYVRRVEFFADNVKIGVREKQFLVAPPTGTHISYDFLWTNAPSGRHVLFARATDNQGLTGSSDAIAIWVVITNPPPVTKSTVFLTATDTVAAEGTNYLNWPGWENSAASVSAINTARFLVRREGSTNEPLTVYYRIEGTASNGVDYAELSGKVTIPARERSVPILIVPIDDPLPEPTETVVLALRQPPESTAALPTYYIGSPSRAAVVIVDDDKPRPTTGVLSDRSFQIALPGTNGVPVRIESSTDMITWTSLGSTVITDGAIHFVDPDADGSTKRFYRAVPDSSAAAQ